MQGKVDKIFVEKQSGKDFNRTIYKALVKKLKPGDCLTVLSLDRLGRNYDEIQEQWRILTKVKNIDICVIDMPLLDTRNGGDLMGKFISDLVLQILAFVAQTEREMTKERARQGREAAIKRGVKFGRPKFVKDEKWNEVYRKFINNELTRKEAAYELGIGYTGFIYRLKQMEASPNYISKVDRL